MSSEHILKDILDKPKPLSSEQRKALLSNNRYIRIVAGAGTGKTETLTRRIAYLLLYKNIEPKDIAAFTFTEKAAQSMKSRIYERVRSLHGDEACAKLGEMYVGTIHGFCLRVLQDHFNYGDHDVLDENQEMAFLLREGWSLRLGVNGRYSQNCGKFLRSVNVIYDELLDREKLKEKAPQFYRHFEKYESLLQNHRLLTFGKMIYLTVDSLQRNPAPISNIKHLIVDEYQDINKAQEALIKLIGKQSCVFIVGDPRQSIYQWRGSDESCFENFTKLFPSCEKVSITENRRSARLIIDAANTFAGTFETAHYEKLKHVRAEEGKCFLVSAETPEEEAEWVVSQVEEYVNSGICNYNDIGILLRSVATSGGPIIDLLRQRNIPYIVGGTVGLFRRDEAQAVGRLFVWAYEKGFWVENPWNWSDRSEGDDLLNTALEYWESATSISLSPTKMNDLKEWKERVASGKFKNFSEAYQELLVMLGFLKLDPSNRLHAAVMANLGRFNTLLTDYESSLRLGGRPVDWTNAVKGLCWFINTYATGAYDEQPSEDIRGIDAVQIMTVHQAKGLEWPVVFIPCLVDRRFPSSQTGTPQEWFVPRSMFDVKRYEGDVESE
ncbi:MAG: ATP-dependent helicase, partial [Candidatus Brockarchaeota archaeon]|nr:ATP-dependent helicase [Candidatus Brockarchaeota archaeon]